MVATGLVACSMHPLPYDVSRVSTYDIVEKLRCEAKEGLRGVPYDHPILKHTVIGYDLTFDITEDNNLNNDALNFNRKGFTDGSHFDLDFAGSATRKRENKRQFRILESLQRLNAADCSDTATRANWIYPITGAIGLDEVLKHLRQARAIDRFWFRRHQHPTRHGLGCIFRRNYLHDENWRQRDADVGIGIDSREIQADESHDHGQRESQGHAFCRRGPGSGRPAGRFTGIRTFDGHWSRRRQEQAGCPHSRRGGDTRRQGADPCHLRIGAPPPVQGRPTTVRQLHRSHKNRPVTHIYHRSRL